MIQALRGLQALQGLLERQAQCQDLQVLRVRLVHRDQQVQLVRQDLQVQQVLLVRQDQAVQLEPQDQLVQRVQLEQVLRHCQIS